MFDDLYGLIEDQRDDAQHDDAGDYHIQLEHLGAIYDQISQSSSGRKEFADDDAHQRQADIHFRGAEQNRHGTGEHYFAESVPPAAAQCMDQSDLLRVHLLESRIETDDGAEYRHGHAGYNDGAGAGAQPYDEQRRQGRFRQAVEHHQIGLQYLR